MSTKKSPGFLIPTKWLLGHCPWLTEAAVSLCCHEDGYWQGTLHYAECSLPVWSALVQSVCSPGCHCNFLYSCDFLPRQITVHWVLCYWNFFRLGVGEFTFTGLTPFSSSFLCRQLMEGERWAVGVRHWVLVGKEWRPHRTWRLSQRLTVGSICWLTRSLILIHQRQFYGAKSGPEHLIFWKHKIYSKIIIYNFVKPKIRFWCWNTNTTRCDDFFDSQNVFFTVPSLSSFFLLLKFSSVAGRSFSGSDLWPFYAHHLLPWQIRAISLSLKKYNLKLKKSFEAKERKLKLKKTIWKSKYKIRNCKTFF